MGAIPTVVVRNKQGHKMTINAVDFDPKLHKPWRPGEGDDAPEPGPARDPGIEGAISVAKGKAALEAIAAEHGLVWDAEYMKLTMHEIRSKLLSQLKGGG